MQKIYLTICYILYCLLLQAQTTIDIPALKDNSIFENATTNSNALGENTFVGNANNGSPRRALIQFDIAGMLPAGAIITSVTLSLNCNITIAGGVNISLHKLNNSWGESTSNAGSTSDGAGTAAASGDVTWNCRFSNGIGGCNNSWVSPGGDYASASALTSVSGTGDYTWSSEAMLSDVQSWLDNPAGNYGWILIGDPTVTPGAKRFGSRENSDPSMRPSLSVTYDTPIPVTLRSFTANKLIAGVLLNWQTEQEINNDHFLIEHSTDGVQFAEIGKVAGHGTTSISHSYTFLHKGFLSGKNFYRLAQTDINGRVVYSSIVRISINTAIGFYFTNPVHNSIVITGFNDSNVRSYEIVDVHGRNVLTGILRNNVINVQSLSNGIYFMKLLDRKESITVKQFLKR